jgi:hypothetical protein
MSKSHNQPVWPNCVPDDDDDDDNDDSDVDIITYPYEKLYCFSLHVSILYYKNIKILNT